MKTELCLIICFITGVLIFYLLKQSCGCGVIEGHGGSGTETVQGDGGETPTVLPLCTSTPNIVLEDGRIYDFNNISNWYPNLDIQSSNMNMVVACLKAQCENKEGGYNFYQYNDTLVNSDGIEQGILTLSSAGFRGTDGQYIACKQASGWVNDSEGDDDTTPTMEVCVADMTKFDGVNWNPDGTPPTFGIFDALYHTTNDDGTNLLDRYNAVQGVTGPQGHGDHWCDQMYTNGECKLDYCKLDTLPVGGG